MTSQWHPRWQLMQWQLHFYVNVFFAWKSAYNKDVAVRSFNYFNQCKVLYVYVDVTVLISQKVDEAFSSQHLPVKSWNSNSKKIECL